MEAPQLVYEAPAKRNQTPLIIAISAIVLCCCCVVLGVAGYYGYFTTYSVEGTPIAPIEEFEPVNPIETGLPTLESIDSLGEAPEGGLGNDILRNDTWTYVAFAAMGQGCDEPISADSTIEVLQEPENGIWVEKWTVACASGDRYPFEVEFILDDTGTTFNIKSLPE